jgi:hypothetical protein
LGKSKGLEPFPEIGHGHSPDMVARARSGQIVGTSELQHGKSPGHIDGRRKTSLVLSSVI